MSEPVFPKIYSPLPMFTAERRSWAQGNDPPTNIPTVIEWEPTIEIAELPSTDDFEMVDRIQLRIDYSPAIHPDEYRMRDLSNIMLSRNEVRALYPGPLPCKTLAFHRYSGAEERFHTLVTAIQEFMREYGIEPGAIRRRVALYPRMPRHINFYINAFADAIGDRNLRRPHTNFREPWNADRAEIMWNDVIPARARNPFPRPTLEPMSVKNRLKSLLEDKRNRNALKLVSRFLNLEEWREFKQHLSVTVKAVPWFDRKIDVIVRVRSAWNMNFEIDGVAIQGCMQAKERSEICELDVFIGTVIALKTNPEYVKQTMNFSPDFDAISFQLLNRMANITPVLDQVNAQAEAEEGQRNYHYQWRAHFGRGTAPNEHSLYDMLTATAET